MFDTGPRAGWLFSRRRSRFRRSSPVGRFEIPGIEVTEIPAGMWVRSTRNRGLAVPDGALLMPVTERWPAIVVGAPGEVRPQVHECARVVESLPGAQRANFALVVYGWEAASVKPFAQQLAERLCGPVASYHGMPFHTADGGTDVTVVGAAGQPTWRPLVSASVHRPGCPPVPFEWRCPADGLMSQGIGSFGLTADWMVDVLPSGLLVRPVGVVADPEVGLIPPHPGHVNLVVATAPPPAVLPAVKRLANALPVDARSRLRLVASPDFDRARLDGLSHALHVEMHGLGRSGPKSPLLVRRFVEPAPSSGEPAEVWGCYSCDTNNFAGTAACRRCGREPAGTTSTNVNRPRR